MKFIKNNSTYIVRLDKGEEVLASIKSLCEKEGIRCGSVSGIGSCSYAKLGVFDLENKIYQSTIVEDTMEITSLLGNISVKDGDIYLHIHATMCDSSMIIHGGHLNECIISGTCEIFINVYNMNVEHQFDENSGINLYKL